MHMSGALLRLPRVVLSTAIALFVLGIGVIAADEHQKVLVEFETDQFPEGLAVAPDGTIYVGIANTGEIIEVTPAGDTTTLAQVPLAEGGVLLGLLVHGSVYALVSAGPESGVYAISRNSGDVALVAELPDDAFPNAIIPGPAGSFLVTDTVGGRVLKVQPFGSTETWVQDPLLLGNVDDPGPLGIPIGANGIAKAPGGDAVYVAVSEGARVVRIAMDASGGAGEVTVLAEGPALAGADGMAVGPGGTLYVTAFVPNHITAIDPDTGSIDVVVSGDALHFPATVRFSPDFETLYVTNFEGFVFFGLEEGPPETSLLAIDASALSSGGRQPGIVPPSTGSGGLIESSLRGSAAASSWLAVPALTLLALAACFHAWTRKPAQG